MASRAWFALAATLSLATVSNADESPALVARSVDPRLGPAFRRVVVAAAERLSSPRCAAVLSDFADSSTGLPLAAHLVETGASAPEHLLGLTYVAGADAPRCAGGRVLAFTAAGSRAVVVCPSAFARAGRTDPGLAANTLVHEALHTLGLADDFPSSYEITRAVERRCGR